MAVVDVDVAVVVDVVVVVDVAVVASVAIEFQKGGVKNISSLVVTNTKMFQTAYAMYFPLP